MTEPALRKGPSGPLATVGGGGITIAASVYIPATAAQNAAAHYQSYKLADTVPCELVVPNNGVYLVQSSLEFVHVQNVEAGVFVATANNGVVIDYARRYKPTEQSASTGQFPAFDNFTDSGLIQRYSYMRLLTLADGDVLSLRIAGNLNLNSSTWVYIRNQQIVLIEVT